MFKTRIIEVDGLYIPQWKFLFFPWVSYTIASGAKGFNSKSDADSWINAPVLDF